MSYSFFQSKKTFLFKGKVLCIIKKFAFFIDTFDKYFLTEE